MLGRAIFIELNLRIAFMTGRLQMTTHAFLKPLPFGLLLIAGVPLWVGLWLCWHSDVHWERQ